MDLGRGFDKSAKGSNVSHLHDGSRIASHSDTILVIKIPDAQILRFLSRAMFMVMALFTLPFLVSVIENEFSSNSHDIVVSGFEAEPDGTINAQLLSLLLHDLADEGLLREDGKALIVNPPYGFEGVIPWTNNEIDEVKNTDLQTQRSFPDESYDFVFASNSQDAKFFGRILKTNGIVALPLGSNPSIAFKEQPNYKVVYLRQYSSIIVALKKTIPDDDKIPESSTRRRLFQTGYELKKVALKGLEDVLLEPPRHASAKSKKYLNKIKCLPDLTGDSLEGYKRRVFIGVGSPAENKGAIEWFQKNYPKKNKKFEIHNLVDEIHNIDASAWLLKHAKEEDYVVMKAEAEVVEKMMMNKGAISLVDELFLECKNEWWHAGKKRKSGRAYWECLALYGRLRDEGVAVHQWWG